MVAEQQARLRELNRKKRAQAQDAKCSASGSQDFWRAQALAEHGWPGAGGRQVARDMDALARQSISSKGKGKIKAMDLYKR